MSLDNVKNTSLIIGKAISEQIDKDNPQEVAGKLMELAALQGNASYKIAMANKALNEKNLALVTDERFLKAGATDKKLIFAGHASEEHYYKDLAEAQFKSLHYSIEACRSLLSALKAEQQSARYQTT